MKKRQKTGVFLTTASKMVDKWWTKTQKTAPCNYMQSAETLYLCVLSAAFLILESAATWT